jgi:D-xylose transport system permease protein
MTTVFTIIAVLLLAAMIGVWQGGLIAYLRIPAFIVTLGGMQMFRGGVLGVTQGKTITPVEDSLVWIAQGYVSKGLGWIIALVVVGLIFVTTFVGRSQKKTYGFDVPPMWRDTLKAAVIAGLVVLYVGVMNRYRGIQVPVLLLAIVALLVSYISTNTRFGRYAYAVGGNLEATRLSGINIRQTIFRVHVMMGLLAGVAGIILTGYVAAGTVHGGANYELDTIASCVIGGTSLMGGKGTIIGAMIGSLIMASIVNGMSVANVPIFWQYIARGLVVIIAVYIDVVSNKQKS